MTEEYCYQAYGLRFRCEFSLPELVEATSHHSPDVNIRLGQVPQDLPNASGKGVLYQASENQFLLKLDDVARFLVENGTTITVQPAKGSIESDVRVFMLGSCLGALLHQRGVLALHASSICTENGAVLFIGNSGAGKSTTLNCFLQRGYEMLSDDIAGLVLDESGSPVVMPAFPRTKLWADAVERLGMDVSNLPRVRPGQQKYEVHAREQFCSTPVPPQRIYLLTTSNKEELNLEDIESIQRFNILLRNTYRMGFLEGLQVQPTHFQLASLVARDTPVVRVVRPHDPRRLDELIDLIEDDFTESGKGATVLPFSLASEAFAKRDTASQQRKAA